MHDKAAEPNFSVYIFYFIFYIAFNVILTFAHKLYSINIVYTSSCSV